MISKHNFLSGLFLMLPFTLLPDTCGRTDALVCPPERLEIHNSVVTDTENLKEGIPKAMQFRSTGPVERFKLKFFTLDITIVYSMEQSCYVFRAVADPRSPYYKKKYVELAPIDLKRYNRRGFYKMKLINEAEMRLLRAYRDSDRVKFYRRTA